jgi:hypothetical protein
MWLQFRMKTMVYSSFSAVEEVVTLNHAGCGKLRRWVWVTRILLLIENSVQYILFRFSKLLTMCNPGEHNVYNPWTRHAWTTYIKVVVVLKAPMFRLIKILQNCQLCVQKVTSALEAHIRNKCYLNKVEAAVSYLITVTKLDLWYSNAFNCVPCSTWWPYIVYAEVIETGPVTLVHTVYQYTNFLNNRGREIIPLSV